MKICRVEKYTVILLFGVENIFYERILIDTEFIDSAIEKAEPFVKLALLVGKWFSRQTVPTSSYYTN